MHSVGPCRGLSKAFEIWRMVVRNVLLGRDPIRGRDTTDPLLAKDDLMGYCIIYS